MEGSIRLWWEGKGNFVRQKKANSSQMGRAKEEEKNVRDILRREGSEVGEGRQSK